MLQTRSNPTKTLTLDFDYVNSIIIWLQWKPIEVQSCDKLKLMVRTWKIHNNQIVQICPTLETTTCHLCFRPDTTDLLLGSNRIHLIYLHYVIDLLLDLSFPLIKISMKLIMEELKAIDDMQVNSTNKLNTTWDLSAPTHASIHFDLT